MGKENNKKLKDTLNSFLSDEVSEDNLECTRENCIIKGDKSLVERINKRVLTEDGRELLM